MSNTISETPGYRPRSAYQAAFKQLAYMATFVLFLAVLADAQVAAEFESGMKTANSVVWEYVIMFVRLAMFIYGFFCLYNAVFGGNKNESWIKILLVFAFVIAAGYWPTIYATITGAGSPINAGP
jgi:hypothetical protein